MARKAHRYVGLLFLGCAAASPSTFGDAVISSTQWLQTLFSKSHTDRSAPAKPHTIHTTRIRAAPGESHPFRHHGGAKPSVTKPPAGQLHLSPAGLSAMLRHAPPHTEAKGIGAPLETQHRIGADVGYTMPELRRVRFGERLGEFFVCSSCETYGWVLQNSEESRVFNVFRAALRDGALCQQGGAATTVLDIGAHEGFYGLLAAAWGCRTYFFEPQPACVTTIAAAILVNGFRDARLVPRPFGPPELNITVSPSTHCAGQYPRRVGEREHHPMFLDRRKDTRTVHAVGLREVLGDLDAPILLAKVDVEGGELGVLQAMMPQLCAGKVLNLVFELTPAWWAQLGESKEHGAEIGAQLEACGFRQRRMVGVAPPRGCQPAGAPGSKISCAGRTQPQIEFDGPLETLLRYANGSADAVGGSELRSLKDILGACCTKKERDVWIAWEDPGTGASG